MFTLDPPTFVSVTVCDDLVPTVTLPKSSPVGLSVSWPAEIPVVVPAREMFMTEFDASLLIESVALKAPAAFGVNTMLMVALCPAAMETGRLGLTRAKYWVEIAALLTVTESGPELVALIVRVLLLPAATLPKSKVEVTRDRERVLACFWPEPPPALTPWQPIRTLRLVRRRSAPAALPRKFSKIALDGVFRMFGHWSVPGTTTVLIRGRAQHESATTPQIPVDT